MVDPCIIRSPIQKPRVEPAVPYCRQAGFAGEDFPDVASGRAGMRRWCLEEVGMRIHGTTQQRPLEHFRQVGLANLLPAPQSRYEVPIDAHPKVARDHHISLGKALYSVPGHIGEQVDAWADSRLVKISCHGVVCGRAYAMRDLEYLQQAAVGRGEPIEIYATQLLARPLPWTRMR